MARYIDVEALKNDGHPCWHDGEGNIYYEIDHAPTADVVEVRHGEWIWTENGEADYEQFWVCSVCKEKSYIKTKFCSDCGAKMDGRRDT